MTTTPKRKRYVLDTVRQQYADAVGGEEIDFEGPGGEVFTMPHPMFADADWSDAVDAAETDEETAEAMLGEEQYARFIDAGGNPADVNFIRMAAMEDMKDVLKKGRRRKARPTRS